MLGLTVNSASDWEWFVLGGGSVVAATWGALREAPKRWQAHLTNQAARVRRRADKKAAASTAKEALAKFNELAPVVHETSATLTRIESTLRDRNGGSSVRDFMEDTTETLSTINGSLGKMRQDIQELGDRSGVIEVKVAGINGYLTGRDHIEIDR